MGNLNRKVLYILSVGHSGSTILDMTLGQFPNVFSTGEMVHLIWQLFREINGIEDSQGKCSCNKKFLECDYWSKIIAKIALDKDLEVKDLPEKFKLKFYDKLSYFEDSYGLKIQRALVKRFPKYNNLPGIKRKIKTLTKNNSLVYRCIFEVTKANFIVDSSKDIIRYYNLEKENDIFPIIIIRDINNLATSKYVVNDFKKLKKDWLNYYNKFLLPLLLKKDEKEFHIVSFEKFLDNPYNEINILGNKIGLDTSSFSTDLLKNNYHLVAGNPMRYNEAIRIKTKSLDKEKYVNLISNSGLNDFYLRFLL